jgi:hypothetical protein
MPTSRTRSARLMAESAPEARAGEEVRVAQPRAGQMVGDGLNDEGMTAEQAKQSAQAVDLGVWVGLAGLEPATERL